MLSNPGLVSGFHPGNVRHWGRRDDHRWIHWGRIRRGHQDLDQVRLGHDRLDRRRVRRPRPVGVRNQAVGLAGCHRRTGLYETG